MDTLIKKSKMLSEEALPYIQKFKDTIFVVKYGGNAMKNDVLKKSVLKDVAFLKAVGISVVIVHGGGPNITEEMKKADIEPIFVKGLRVTNKRAMKIVEKMSKSINKEIQEILELYDTDSESVEQSIYVKQKNKDLGFVGEVVKVDIKKIKKVIKKNKIPIISHIGVSEDRKVKYNVNADTIASSVAVALSAKKFTLLTDVDGVLHDGNLISHLSISQANKFIKNGVIHKGMIPKVEACIFAVMSGVEKAHLINGTTPHSLLFEVFTKDGIGTEIVKSNV